MTLPPALETCFSLSAACQDPGGSHVRERRGAERELTVTLGVPSVSPFNPWAWPRTRLFNRGSERQERGPP